MKIAGKRPVRIWLKDSEVVPFKFTEEVLLNVSEKYRYNCYGKSTAKGPKKSSAEHFGKRIYKRIRKNNAEYPSKK